VDTAGRPERGRVFLHHPGGGPAVHSSAWLAGILKKAPNDITILSVAAVELALVVYLVGSIVRVIAGEQIAGEAWEFWGYLATAMLLPRRRRVLVRPGTDPLEQLCPGRRRRHRPGDGRPNEPDLVLKWKKHAT
jgi:hypothetical protein